MRKRIVRESVDHDVSINNHRGGPHVAVPRSQLSLEAHAIGNPDTGSRTRFSLDGRPELSQARGNPPLGLPVEGHESNSGRGASKVGKAAKNGNIGGEICRIPLSRSCTYITVLGSV